MSKARADKGSVTINLETLRGRLNHMPLPPPGPRGQPAGASSAHLLQVVLEVEEGQVSLHLPNHLHGQSLLFMDDRQVQEPEGRQGNPPRGGERTAWGPPTSPPLPPRALLERRGLRGIAQGRGFWRPRPRCFPRGYYELSVPGRRPGTFRAPPPPGGRAGGRQTGPALRHPERPVLPLAAARRPAAAAPQTLPGPGLGRPRWRPASPPPPPPPALRSAPPGPGAGGAAELGGRGRRRRSPPRASPAVHLRCRSRSAPLQHPPHPSPPQPSRDPAARAQRCRPCPTPPPPLTSLRPP